MTYVIVNVGSQFQGTLAFHVLSGERPHMAPDSFIEFRKRFGWLDEADEVSAQELYQEYLKAWEQTEVEV